MPKPALPENETGNAPAPKAPLKAWRVAFWAALGALFVAVFLLFVSVLFYYILLIPPVQQRVLRFAELQMSSFMLGDVTIERVESDLLRRIELHGVRAKGGVYGDSIYAGRITVKYYLPALLKKTVRVSSVDLRDVYGHVVWADRWIRLPVLPQDLAQPPPPSDSGKVARDKEGEEFSVDSMDWKIDLGTARVFNLNAVYRDSDLEFLGEIVNTRAEARFHELDSFSVKLQVPDARYESPWWTGDLDTIGATGVITWKHLEIFDCHVLGSGSDITGGGRIAFSSEGHWDLSADVNTLIEPLPVLYNSLPGLGRQGRLKARASWVGSLREPVLSAEVSGQNLSYDDFDIGSLNLDAGYGEDRFVRLLVHGGSSLGRVDLASSMRIDSLMSRPSFGDYTLSAQLSRLDLKSLLKKVAVPVAVPGDTGSVRLSVDGSGISDVPSLVKASLGIGGGRLEGRQLDLSGSLNRGAWSVEGNWGLNRVEGKGTLGLHNLSVLGYVAADIPVPSLISNQFLRENVGGRLMSHMDIMGKIDNPRIEAMVKGDELEWRGIRADSVDASLVFADREFALSRADAIIAGDLETVAPYFGLDSLSGNVRVDMSMTGRLGDMFAHAFVSGERVRYGPVGADAGFGVVVMEGDTLSWTDFSVREKGTALRSDGKLVLRPYLELETETELLLHDSGLVRPAGSLSLSGILRGDTVSASYRVSGADLRIADPWTVSQYRLKGTLYALGELSGSLKNPEGFLELQAMEPSTSDYRIANLTSSVKLADSLVSAEGWVGLMGSQTSGLSFNSVLPVLPGAGWKIDESGKRTALVEVGADSFNIESVAALLGEEYVASGPARFKASLKNEGRGWAMDGSAEVTNAKAEYAPGGIRASGVNLKVNAAGTLKKPDASFTLSSGPVIMPRVRIENTFFQGRTGYDTLFLDEANLNFKDNGHVSVRARAPYASMDSILYKKGLEADFKIMRFPTAVIAPFLQQYAFRKGLLNGGGRVSVDQGRPVVNGDLSLSGLELTIPDIQPVMGPINADLTFSGDKVEVRSARAKWGSGAIQTSGHAVWDLQKLRDLDLRVRADKLSFELPEVFYAGIDQAGIRITDRSDGSIMVSGNVGLGQTRYVRDVRILDMVNQMQISQEVRREPNPLLQSVLLRVEVDLAENVNVDMNLGSLNLDGRMVVNGNLSEPGFSGDVKLMDGYVLYLDRKFTISKGSLYNPDPFTLNPNLDIKAYSEVWAYSPMSKDEQFLIHLNVTGTLQNPVVRFSSEPSLSQLDILSVLTLGQRMGAIGSDLNDRLKTFAAQQVAGFGARKLEQLLGFERIELSGDLLSMDGDQSPRLSIAKRLTSRLILTYETLVGRLSERKMKAHYRLTPHIYLEGETTSDGKSGVDLIFRYSR
ncbi:MAG: translocation/assembly module TamB domain-containing protein [Chitinispirillaceae bacterium]